MIIVYLFNLLLSAAAATVLCFLLVGLLLQALPLFHLAPFCLVMAKDGSNQNVYFSELINLSWQRK